MVSIKYNSIAVLELLIVILLVLALTAQRVHACGSDTMALGMRHTCAILIDGQAKCWGFGGYGQLGYGNMNNIGYAANQMGSNLPYVDVGTGKLFVQITAGIAHTCGLLNDFSVKCYGNGEKGQLGYGNTDNKGDEPNEMGSNLPSVSLGSGRTSIFISAGGNHTCSILDNNGLKCWGEGAFGQLGYGDTSNRGDDPNEMGDKLPLIDVGTSRFAQTVSLGNEFTCALLDNGQVKCWGFSGEGQLGYGNSDTIGDQPGEMGDNLPYVSFGQNRFVQCLSSKYIHSCVILENDKAKCWGNNYIGGLGYGDEESRGDDPGEMGDDLPEIDFGNGKLVETIYVGFYFACATFKDQSAKCWGDGWAGELGYGDRLDRGNEPNEMGSNLPDISIGTSVKAMEIYTAYAHTCVKTLGAGYKCWGQNIDGRLGYGNTETIGIQPSQMGNNLPMIDVAAPKSGVPTKTPTTKAPTIPTKTPTKAPANPTTTPSKNPIVTNVPTKAPVNTTPTKAPVNTTPTNAPVTPAPVKVPTKAPVNSTPTKVPVASTPTKAPMTNAPSKAPSSTLVPTKAPFASTPTKNPTSKPGSTLVPTTNPTPMCNYTTKSACKADPNCKYKKKGKKCVIKGCASLTTAKQCKKKKAKCKWNASTNTCETKTTSADIPFLI